MSSAPAAVVLLALAVSAAAVLPEQIRIALTAGDTSATAMTVVFGTSNLTEPGYAPIVQWSDLTHSDIAFEIKYS